MPSWNEIQQKVRSAYDTTRRDYVKELSNITGRNVITYYSAFLQKPHVDTTISDRDKVGFMSVLYRLDTKKGLDLVLHTPGGDVAATESIVSYLKSKFGKNIRVIVPELAMSAGTMIACASKSILMGQHSSLGPIDPQFGDISAVEVIKEFERAHKEIKADETKAHVWRPIIAKYQPGFVNRCEQALKWSKTLATTWLKENMLKNDKSKADKVANKLTDKEELFDHSRHISANEAIRLGLIVEKLEDDQQLQDAVLSVHHATTCTLSDTNAYKIIENQEGIYHISAIG